MDTGIKRGDLTRVFHHNGLDDDGGPHEFASITLPIYAVEDGYLPDNDVQILALSGNSWATASTIAGRFVYCPKIAQAGANPNEPIPIYGVTHWMPLPPGA